MPFATTWMKLEGFTLSEIRQRKTTVYDITYVWNLKIKQTSEYNKTETDSQIQRTN